MDVCDVLKAQGGDGRLAGALSRCSSLSSINTSSGLDVESPSDTASLSAHHLIRTYVLSSFISRRVSSRFPIGLPLKPCELLERNLWIRN